MHRKRTTLSVLVFAFLVARAINGSENPAETVGSILPPPRLLSVSPPGILMGGETDLVVKGVGLENVERFWVSGTGVEIHGQRLGTHGEYILTLRTNPGVHAGYRDLRAKSASGVSNFLRLRLDPFVQITEIEPNDDLAGATAVTMNSAAIGSLKKGDLDHYGLEGKAGQRVVLDVEARRLGIPIDPVIRVFDPKGTVLDQGWGTRGCQGDVRRVVTLPADGRYVIQIHDLTYQGGSGMHYRVRLGELSFATGMFPLGGRCGQPVRLSLAGGTLERPVSFPIKLPDTPGVWGRDEPIPGSAEAIWFPQRMEVGDNPEVLEESTHTNESSITVLPSEAIANGRIERPRERDRYQVRLTKGKPLRIQVLAAALGSWLDSVVSLEDSEGKQLAESDDGGREIPMLGFHESAPVTDSVLDFVPAEDGVYTVVVRDRYGAGGPEFAYRLSVCEPAGDFSLSLRLPNGRDRSQSPASQEKDEIGISNTSDALNVRPGAEVSLDVTIRTEGRVGPVRLQVHGLPHGAKADVVTVRPSRSGAPGTKNVPGGVGNARLTIRTDANAQAGLGMIHVEGTSRLSNGKVLTRRAWITVPVRGETGSSTSRPLVWSSDEVPFCVLGGTKP